MVGDGVMVGASPPGGVAVKGEGGVGEGPWVMVGLGGLVGVTKLAGIMSLSPTRILFALAASILFAARMASKVELNLEAIPLIVSPGWTM